MTTFPSSVRFVVAVSALLAAPLAFAQPMSGGGTMSGGAPAAMTYPSDLQPAYADTSASQILDLFLPGGEGPFPVVVNIHGGGFALGSKEMLDAAVARVLLAEGVAVASINYRLSGEAVFPAAVQDAKAAVRFLRANAGAYNLDPERFVAFGQSAGANIASMLGTTGDVAAFDDPSLGNAGVSSRVQVVVNWYGPNNFLLMDEQAAAQGCSAEDQTHGTAESFESRYLGAAIGTVPELVEQANPVTYITEGDAPTLLQKGDQDCTVPIAQSELLYDALTEAGIEAEYDLLKNVGHGDDINTTTPVFASDENVQRVVAFITMALE